MTYTPYTIRKTWHYGNDRKVTEHSGAFIIDALHKAAPDMPESHVGAALDALRRGDVYDGWSWMRLELVTGSRFGLFGNRGEYRMPHTPDFDSAEEARAYFRHWYPGGNRYIVVLPLNR